ncbi:MAG: hypothetical protein ACE148_01165 [Vicinamibacterales bacterium]
MLDRLPIAYSLDIGTALGEHYHSDRLTGVGMAALPRILLPEIKLQPPERSS